MSLVRRLPVPFGSFGVTLRHALALGVDRTKLLLSFGIPAFGFGPGAFKVNDLSNFESRSRRLARCEREGEQQTDHEASSNDTDDFERIPPVARRSAAQTATPQDG